MGDIDIMDDNIVVSLKKKRQLPAILELTSNYQSTSYPWLNNLKLIFQGATYS